MGSCGAKNFLKRSILIRVGSITDLLKWFSPIDLFIFLSERLAIRCQVSGIARPETYMSPET